MLFLFQIAYLVFPLECWWWRAPSVLVSCLFVCAVWEKSIGSLLCERSNDVCWIRMLLSSKKRTGVLSENALKRCKHLSKLQYIAVHVLFSCEWNFKQTSLAIVKCVCKLQVKRLLQNQQLSNLFFSSPAQLYAFVQLNLKHMYICTHFKGQFCGSVEHNRNKSGTPINRQGYPLWREGVGSCNKSLDRRFSSLADSPK